MVVGSSSEYGCAAHRVQNGQFREAIPACLFQLTSPKGYGHHGNVEVAMSGKPRHGHCRMHRDSPEYKSWSMMWDRCRNPHNNRFKNYGGRGISVCPSWASFERFLNDMRPRPIGYTIERKDNNGNYCPENCMWASKRMQARNRRGNRLITYNGVTRCVSEWAEILGMERHVIINRLKRGWTVHQALTISICGTHRKVYSSPKV